MEFPILNISSKKWNEDNISSYIAFDKFIYTDKDLIFNELYKNKLFCDCHGEIFRAIEKAELTEKWRNWLRFMPNIWKREVLFEPTNNKLTVDELRDYLHARISDLNQNDFTQQWKKDLTNANSHFELINMQS